MEYTTPGIFFEVIIDESVLYCTFGASLKATLVNICKEQFETSQRDSVI